MQRRLDIAASILVTPDVLFLDEPTTGLDPRSRSQVWEIVRALVAAGTTVLLTTQDLDEADELADRITVIDDGTVIAEGTSGELKALTGAHTLHVRLLEPHQLPEAEYMLSRALAAPVHARPDLAALSAQVPAAPGNDGAGTRAVSALTELHTAGIALDQFALDQPSLDEVFLALTGHRANHPAPQKPVTEESAR
jgi:ABC-2 type transport system ATP-binding protein